MKNEWVRILSRVFSEVTGHNQSSESTRERGTWNGEEARNLHLGSVC